MRLKKRMTVTLEVDSRVPIADLRKAEYWNNSLLFYAKDEDGKVITVIQAQANTILRGKE